MAYDVIKLTDTKRKDFIDAAIPKVQKVDSTEYQKDNLKETFENNGLRNRIILPLSDCKLIGASFEKGVYSGALVNKIYYYDKEDINACKNIHSITAIQEQLKKESAWFVRVKNLTTPPGLPKINMEVIDEFRQILLNGFNDKCCNPKAPRLLTSDVSLLIGQEWLSLEVLEHFMTMLNQIRRDSFLISMPTLFSRKRGGDVASLVKEWFEDNVQRLAIIMNVGKNNRLETFLAQGNNRGSHWATLLIDIKLGKVVYCDSLAWEPPAYLLGQLDFLLSSINTVYNTSQQNFNVVEVSHKLQGSNTVVHICKDKCIKFFPYQGPNKNICGVACLLSAILVTESSLVNHVQLSRSLPDNFRWLSKLHNYNNFARCLLMKWYVSGIELKDIGLLDEVYNYFD